VSALSDPTNAQFEIIEDEDTGDTERRDRDEVTAAAAAEDEEPRAE